MFVWKERTDKDSLKIAFSGTIFAKQLKKKPNF